MPFSARRSKPVIYDVGLLLLPEVAEGCIRRAVLVHVAVDIHPLLRDVVA